MTNSLTPSFCAVFQDGSLQIGPRSKTDGGSEAIQFETCLKQHYVCTPVLKSYDNGIVLPDNEWLKRDLENKDATVQRKQL